MTNNIDHDRLFKELISTFFVEFIELFFPQVMDYLDRDSITFLDKEVFTDVTEGENLSQVTVVEENGRVLGLIEKASILTFLAHSV